MNTSQKSPPIIFLMGPTASGKTDLAIELIRHIPAEIISVDSAMIYRTMNIGTGKPTSEQLQQSPHHLINVKDPKEAYSAAEFRKDALQKIAEIKAEGRIPLLVGGTFLYFRALQEGLSPLPSADPSVRAALLLEAETRGWKEMHNRLRSIDPIAAERIHPNDPQRVQRALEVYVITGRPMSTFFGNGAQNQNDDLCNIQSFALYPRDRHWLHQRIEKRFYRMLEQGLVSEVEELYKRGDLDLNRPSMRAVGYRQVWEYLSGEYSYEAMVQRAIAATRQLAKRQLTWLRSLSNVNRLEIENNHSDPLKSMIHFLS
jgi:tRNA dimethylallyltransferase